MKRLSVYLLPFFLIIVIVLVFFYPVYIKGLIPLPADHMVGIYYPWLDYKWPGFPAGVPVKNPITADVVSFIYPMQTYAVQLMKQGTLPLWNPLILTGSPLLANFQSAPFSPTNFLYFLLPKLSAWTVQIILQPILGSIFLFLLLKYFKRSDIASIFGAIAYSFSGFMMIWLEWNGHALVAAFFPLVILLIFKLLDKSNIFYGFLLSLVIAMQIFSGYPQIIIYQFLAIGISLILMDWKRLLDVKKVLFLSLFIVLGIGMTSLQTIPGYELISNSQRGVEVVNKDWALLRLRSTITFLAPDYFGNHATYNYWGPADYTQNVGFSGVIAVTLGLLGLFVYVKDKWVRFALTWIIFAIIYSFDNPISRIIFSSGLLSSQAASAHRALVLSNLGFAILSAFGLDAVFLNKANKKQIMFSFLIPGMILIGYLVFSVLVLKYPGFYPDHTENISKIIANMNVGIRNLIIPLILLLFLVLSMIIVRFKPKLSRLVILFISFLMIFEVFRFGWKYTPFSPRVIVFPETPIFEFLKKQKQPFRINANEVVPVNLMMPYGLETVEGYDAVYSLRFAKYLSSMNSGVDNSVAMGRYGLIFHQNSNLFSIANGKFVLALKRDKFGAVDKNGDIDPKFNNIQFKKVFEDKSVVILENKNALPRAMLFYNWEIVKDQRTILSKLIGNYPISKKIILEENNDLSKSNGVGYVDLSNFNNSGVIKLTTDKPGYLFISSAWYPGWVAYVDGHKERALQADYNFMAIPIKKSGNHMVELKYQPDTFNHGLKISIFSLSVLILVTGCYYLVIVTRKYIHMSSRKVK